MQGLFSNAPKMFTDPWVAAGYHAGTSEVHEPSVSSGPLMLPLN